MDVDGYVGRPAHPCRRWLGASAPTRRHPALVETSGSDWLERRTNTQSIAPARFSATAVRKNGVTEVKALYKYGRQGLLQMRRMHRPYSTERLRALPIQPHRRSKTPT